MYENNVIIAHNTQFVQADYSIFLGISLLTHCGNYAIILLWRKDMETFTKIISSLSKELVFKKDEEKLKVMRLIDYLNDVKDEVLNDFGAFTLKRNWGLVNCLDELYELTKAIAEKDYDLYLCAPAMQEIVDYIRVQDKKYLSALNDFLAKHNQMKGAMEFTQNYKALMGFIDSKWENIQKQLTQDITQKVADMVVPTTSNLIILANAKNFLGEKYLDLKDIGAVALHKTIENKLKELNINKNILPAYDFTKIKEIARERRQDKTDLQMDYYDLLEKVRGDLLTDYYCDVFGTPSDEPVNYLIGIFYDNLRRKTKEEKDEEYSEGTNLVIEHKKELSLIFYQEVHGTKEKEETFDFE